jgi:hypothetical protein
MNVHPTSSRPTLILFSTLFNVVPLGRHTFGSSSKCQIRNCTVFFHHPSHLWHQCVTYRGFYSRWKFIFVPETQHTTVKHSQQLFEHAYTSNLYGLGTLTPLEVMQQNLFRSSSNANSHSCNQEASKHTSGQSIFGLSVHLHTRTACSSPHDRLCSPSTV